jgi:hypothetical protein
MGEKLLGLTNSMGEMLEKRLMGKNDAEKVMKM